MTSHQGRKKLLSVSIDNAALVVKTAASLNHDSSQAFVNCIRVMQLFFLRFHKCQFAHGGVWKPLKKIFLYDWI